MKEYKFEFVQIDYVRKRIIKTEMHYSEGDSLEDAIERLTKRYGFDVVPYHKEQGFSEFVIYECGVGIVDIQDLNMPIRSEK